MHVTAACFHIIKEAAVYTDVNRLLDRAGGSGACVGLQCTTGQILLCSFIHTHPIIKPARPCSPHKTLLPLSAGCFYPWIPLLFSRPCGSAADLAPVQTVKRIPVFVEVSVLARARDLFPLKPALQLGEKTEAREESSQAKHTQTHVTFTCARRNEEQRA